MSTDDFSCRAYGKWILAGEHAVLRGVPALVFPLASRDLKLSYFGSSGALELHLGGSHGSDMQLLFWGVLEKACELLKISRADFHGRLIIDSSIPVGAGMGASAALCVAVTRWLGHLKFVSENSYYEFARQLENLFHGESSGVDIAVALSGQGLYFMRDGERRPLSLAWRPRWYISYSGQRGVTVEAVNKVKALIAKDPTLGRELDQHMHEAVLQAEEALVKMDEHSFLRLAEAIEKAGLCFERWGLNAGAPANHMRWLREQGAFAVKPTGSGGGGFVLSLWKEEPPKNILSDLIPCFE